MSIYARPLPHGPRPKPGPGQILEIWGPGNPEIWDPKNGKNKNPQNPNPFCPNCWQGLDWLEKNPPAPFGAIPCHFLHGPKKSKKMSQFLIFLPIFPVWSNGCNISVAICIGVLLT